MPICRPSFKLLSVAIASAAALCAIPALAFISSGAPPGDEGARAYAAAYRVGDEAGEQIARINRLAARGLWEDAEGPWALAYERFARHGHDGPIVASYAASEVLTFWIGGGAPDARQRADIECLILYLLDDPDPNRVGVWSAVALAARLGIVNRPDIAAAIDAIPHAGDPRPWAASIR